MFDFIKKVNRINPEWSAIAAKFTGCNGHIQSDSKAVTFETNNKGMQNAIHLFSKTSIDISEVVNMFSAICVYNDSNSDYYTMSKNLADYVNKLGVLRCTLSDILPIGRFVIFYRLNNESVTTFVNVENSAVSIYTLGSSDKSIYNGFSNVRLQNNFETSINDIDLINGECVFNSLSFVVKFFQCVKEGISIDRTNTIERSYNKSTGIHRLKAVKYISLSKIGESRYNELETALERIKTDPIYSVASWYRRPHYRKGNIFVRGAWCNRKESLLSEDDREVIYTM